MMDNKVTKYINQKRYYQPTGVVFIIGALIYLTWLGFHLNLSAWWLSIPYFGAQTYMFLLVVLSIINHWKVSYRTKRPALPTTACDVAVVVPTLKEPIPILKKTIKSLLHLNYPGKVVIVVSNDDQDLVQKSKLEKLMAEMSEYWASKLKEKEIGTKGLYLRHSTSHGQAKAGNLNQALKFLKKHFGHIDLVLTQDADEIAYPDLLYATVGYFTNPKVAYVQTIKQAKVSKEDPFGNHDLMWYGRTAPSKDVDNAMFACGSAVVWRISAVESIGGFSTWNLVEDLTTSYELLSKGWQSRYHYEALSIGLAPEDLPNFIKQRGTWAIDALRIFFWDNPIFKKGLSVRQKLQFLEPPLFYINGVVVILLVIATSLSLIFTTWPTTANAIEHALFLLPSFIALEAYFLLRGGEIPFRRVRQFWVGLAPVFAKAMFMALLHDPDNKPKYLVTKKENTYGNYLHLVWPQIAIVGLIIFAMIKTVVLTPLYSAFDWAVVFWGFYQASFFFQIIKVSFYKWVPMINYELANSPIFRPLDISIMLKLKLSELRSQFRYSFLSRVVR